MKIAIILFCSLLFFQSNTLQAQVINNNGAAISVTNGTFVQGDTLENTAGTITNNGTIGLNGHYINMGTTGGNGIYNLEGNWANTGVFNAGTSTVNFIGNNIQSITGAGGELFNNLTISNSGATSTTNRIILLNNVNVSGILSISQGNVETGVNILYLVNQSPTSLNYTSLTGSRVIGKFERGINAAANYLFPVGSDANYNPLNLTLNNVPTAGSVLSEFMPVDPGDSGLPLEDDSVEIYQAFDDGYWSLTANAFSSNSFNINLDGAGFTPPFQDINRIIKRDAGGDWLLDGKHSDAIGTIAFRDTLTGDISPLGTHFALGRCRPRIWVQPQDTAVCDGESAAFSVVATGRQPLTYQWQLNMGLGWNDISDGGIYSGATTDTLNLSTTSTIMNGYRYRVVIKDKYENTKISVLSATLVVNPRPVVTATPSLDTICNLETAHVELTSNVLGTAFTLEVLYSGSILGTSTTLDGDTIKQTLQNPTLAADSVVYRIYPTGPLPTSCGGTADTVIIWVEPTVQINAVNDTICNGSATNIMVTSPNTTTNGIRYTWTVVEDPNISGAANSTGNGQDISTAISNNLTNSGLVAQKATYTITPWTVNAGDNNECTDAGEVITIDIWVEPTVQINAVNDTICDGDDTNIMVTSPNTTTNGIRYTWTVADNPNITGENNSSGNGYDIGTAIIQTLDNISDSKQLVRYVITPWTVNAGDDNECSDAGEVITIDIWVEPTPRVIATIFDDTICNDTYTHITLSTPTTLTDGIVTFDYTATAVGITNYSTGLVNLTDGYIIEDSLHNTSPPYTPKQVTYTIIPRAIVAGCADGPSLDAIITVHPTANTYFDSNNTNDSVTCYHYSDAYAQIVAENGVGIFTYEWDDPLSQTNALATGLSQGSYIVTVTDNQGCIITDTILIHEPDSLFTPADSIADVTCNGFGDGFIRIVPFGGNGSYNYNWSTGATTDTIGNLAGNLYYVTVMDWKGCAQDTVILVQEPGQPSASISKQNVVCFGEDNGWARIDAVGATGYEWSNNQTTQQINNLRPGWYYVTALSAEACQIEKSVEITEPKILTSDIISSNISCAGDSDGTIDLTVEGGNDENPYVFTWVTSDGSGLVVNTEDQSELSGGTYYLTVSDYLNCEVLDTALINEPPTFLSSIINNDITCNGDEDGSIELSATGGNGGYSYLWSNGETLSDLGNLDAGEYLVTIYDSKDCEIYDTATIYEPDLLEAIISGTDISCFGYDDGIAKLDILGGNGGYVIDWSNGANVDSIYGLSIGTYYVTVSDVNNCATTNYIEISQPEQILSNLLSENITCFGFNNGQITVSPTGGVIPYSYSWAHNILLTDNVANSLDAGSYSVSIIDNNNCLEVSTVDITQPDPLMITVNKEDISCYGMDDGYISLSLFGGTPEYNYVWSNENNQNYEYEEASVDNLTGGIYNINILDLHNCQIDTSVSIDEPDKLIVDPIIRRPTCPDIQDGYVELNIDGGIEPYYIYWDNGSSEENLYDIRSGIYDLIINDENSCEIDTSFTIRSAHNFCLEIPSAFSPNEDNINDKWEINMQELYPYAEIEVFDRWGKRVFYSKGYEESQYWDGIFSGKKLPMDNYFYIIYLRNGASRISGTVTLLR